MSKENFIKQACALYNFHSTGCDWLGPNNLLNAACWNWALFGGIHPSPVDISEAVHILGTQGMSNSRQERRNMVRGFIGESSELTLTGDAHGDALDPAWNNVNQFFIGSATNAQSNEPIHWSHWWIEIRNINFEGWNGPNSLLLETVPGKALRVRKGEEIGDYVSGDEWGALQVGIPVDELSNDHYNTMDYIFAARLKISHEIFPEGAIPERSYEYLEESGLWQNLLGTQNDGKPRNLLRISVPNNYVRPSIRRVQGQNLIVDGGYCEIAGQDEQPSIVL